LPEARKLSQLSRGMLMKAALLSSLAYRPKLLVLDEPFSGLDPLVRDEFIKGVLEVSATGDWTVFVSSHDIDEVERLADHVAMLEDGRLRLSERNGNVAGPLPPRRGDRRAIEFHAGRGLARLGTSRRTHEVRRDALRGRGDRARVARALRQRPRDGSADDLTGNFSDTRARESRQRKGGERVSLVWQHRPKKICGA